MSKVLALIAFVASLVTVVVLQLNTGQVDDFYKGLLMLTVGGVIGAQIPRGDAS